MEKFNYQAKDKEGKRVSGVVEAKNAKLAAKVLQEKGLLVISIVAKQEGLLSSLRLLKGRISADDKVAFTRQLSTMANAGLPLTDALSILEVQASPGMQPVVSNILREIESGSSLSDALEKQGKVFDKVFTSLVRAGETAGVLNEVLTRLADNLEKQQEFRRKIKGAMIYPIIIVGGMLAVMLIMMIFVMPKMTSLYEEFEADLPFTTKMLIGLSDLMTKYVWLLFLMIIGGFFGVRALWKRPQFRDYLDQLLFRVPIIGKLRKGLVLTEFTRTLGMLVSSGILVNDALIIVKDVLSSRSYKEALELASGDVQRGLPLASSLAQSEVFPPILPQMMSIGEETGKLDEILGKLAIYFEQETEVLIKGLTTAMEPLIMVLLGVGVAFMMIAIIMPIYQLTNQF